MHLPKLSRRHLHGKYLRAVALVLIVLTVALFYTFGVDTRFAREYNEQFTNQTINPQDTGNEASAGQDIILTLVRNSELEEMKKTIEEFEKRFNSKFHYDWWFMNDEEFTHEFRSQVETLISANVKFIKIPEEYWSYPDHIDQERASASREEYAKKGIMYGKSESYRFMCRFNSGMFYKLPELKNVEYYWRIEPSVRFACDITYDVFQYMRDNGKLYAFNMALQEDVNTIPTLWNATKTFFVDHPQLIAAANNIAFVTDDQGLTYNLCHFWSNFEIANLNFYRDSGYDEYFQFLEREGGFFYERWGDAPVHTLAVSIMLPADKIHFVGNTGYFHKPNQDCPVDDELRNALQCSCNPKRDFTWHKWSCVSKFHEIHDYLRPDSLSNIEEAYPSIYDSIIS